jgi:hypothetical protein
MPGLIVVLDSKRKLKKEELERTVNKCSENLERLNLERKRRKQREQQQQERQQFNWSSFLTILLRLFLSLLDQIKSPHCKAAVGVLHAAKSRSLKHWKEMVCSFISILPIHSLSQYSSNPVIRLTPVFLYLYL